MRASRLHVTVIRDDMGACSDDEQTASVVLHDNNQQRLLPLIDTPHDFYYKTQRSIPHVPSKHSPFITISGRTGRKKPKISLSIEPSTWVASKLKGTLLMWLFTGCKGSYDNRAKQDILYTRFEGVIVATKMKEMEGGVMGRATTARGR